MKSLKEYIFEVADRLSDATMVNLYDKIFKKFESNMQTKQGHESSYDGSIWIPTDLEEKDIKTLAEEMFKDLGLKKDNYSTDGWDNNQVYHFWATPHQELLTMSTVKGKIVLGFHTQAAHEYFNKKGIKDLPCQ